MRLSKNRLRHSHSTCCMPDGKDLRNRPLIERKAALQPVLAQCARIKFASHIEEDGEAFFDQVSELALEGIVCKRVHSPYVAGPSATG